MQQDDARSTGFFPGSLPILASIALACLSQTSPVYSQIAPDGTLSTNVTTTNNLNFAINDGNRVGNNLFHSFREFSVPTGGEAFFNNAQEIQNIFSRVTGGTISNIDGLIRAKGNANLFLLNPSGIIFGPNARLNIGGSFLATTASSFKFADGVEFSATNPQATPLLTIDVPIGLQIGANPGNIVNRSIATDSNSQVVGMQVQPGRSLVLVGGDVTASGSRLNAPGGRIELGGLATAGTVGLTVNGNTLSLSFPADITTRANVSLIDDAIAIAGGEAGGDIVVNANKFTATNGGRLVVGTIGAGDGGNLSVNANSINMSGQGSINRSGLYSLALPGSTGNLGNIAINAETLNLAEGAIVRSATASTGNAGNVLINANHVNLSGLSAIESGTVAQGSTGNVTINTRSLTVRDRATVGVVTESDGAAGTLIVNASELVELIGTFSGLITGTQPNSRGNAGDVTINTRRLMLRDGAAVSAGTLGSGSGGNITINASESVELSGITNTAILFPSERGSRIDTVASSFGNAGSITITTGRLTVRDGGDISASATDGIGNAGNVTIRATDVELIGATPESFFPSRIWAVGSGGGGTGKGGNITVEAQRLILRDGAEISAGTLGQGNAGNVTVRASSVQLSGTRIFQAPDNGATLEFQTRLAAVTFGAGNGGNITVETERLMLQDGAQISSEASVNSTGNAGNVTIRAQDVQLIGTGTLGTFSTSGLSATNFGDGNGGNIIVETERLSIQNGAEISAGTAFRPDQQLRPGEQPTPAKPGTLPGGGDAGNILIGASESVEMFGISKSGLRSLSRISSDVGLNTVGNGGRVNIETGRLTLRDGAEISSATFGIGNAGFVNVRASVAEISGGLAGFEGSGRFVFESPNGFVPSRLTAEVFPNARGNGGTVTVNTDRLTVGDRAQLSVSSQGQGNPGNLEVTSGNLLLDSQGFLTAASSTGRGGNINLQSRNIQLRRQSVISAASAPGAIEGNIGINTETLVLLEASQIRTDAFAPNGGSNIRISPLDESEAIFQSPDSIINASGQLTIEGDIQTEQPQIHGVEIVDSSRLIVDRCAPVRQGSSFVVTGRGGIPSSPNESLSGETVLVDLVTLEAQEQVSRGAGEQVSRGNTEESLATSATTPSTQLVEATGWIINEKGQVVLIASAPTATPYLLPVGCVSGSVTHQRF
ncbi:filamentous hemagglutinin N-terminal domain-containing protein [Microseira sp. BLCC-F43]|uniref:two-partner secretion domain-containing protein n=1 Tax=Microseira sp. BLCC-F43 TaxID=3153602 RepID=UPI0035BC31DB